MKSERKNAPKAWKLWAMESSSGERRDLDLLQTNRRGMVESNKNQHSSMLDIPAQFEQYYTKGVLFGSTFAKY